MNNAIRNLIDELKFIKRDIEQYDDGNIKTSFSIIRDDLSKLYDAITNPEVEEILDGTDFWVNWVYPDGANPEEIKNELLDYNMILHNASKVYDHVTKGRISKPNTHAEAVIGEFETLWREKKL